MSSHLPGEIPVGRCGMRSRLTVLSGRVARAPDLRELRQ